MINPGYQHQLTVGAVITSVGIAENSFAMHESEAELRITLCHLRGDLRNKPQQHLWPFPRLSAIHFFSFVNYLGWECRLPATRRRDAGSVVHHLGGVQWERRPVELLRDVQVT